MSTAPLPDLWLSILKNLESRLPRPMFFTWFRNTAALSLEQGTLVIGLPLPMFLNWHLEHYRELTLQSAQTVESGVENIVYQVDISLNERDPRVINLLQHFPDRRPRKVPNQPAVRLPEGLTSRILNPRYTLENFIAGTSTRLAHAACTAVAMEPGGKYNPLFIYGGVGLGKTHLLQATGNAILRNTPGAAVLYTTSEDFTNQVVEAIQHKKMEQFHKRYRSLDVLIIDDIQFIANKERTQEIFFHTFNTLYEYQKQIIISSDRPPKALTLLQDRLRSRFDRGMIADVQPPDYETRLAILQNKAREYGLFIESTLLQYIAERVTLNVRSLEGILMQAVARYELEHRMPTVKTIEEILQKLQEEKPGEDTPGFLQEKERAVTLENVLEGVSGYYSVSLQDIVGESRVREVLIPRQIAMYIGKKKLRISYVRLGEVFSGRDHTTVMHAVAKIDRKIQEDPQLLREVRAIEKEVGLAK